MTSAFEIVYGPHCSALFEKVKAALENKKTLIVANSGTDLKFLEHIQFPKDVVFGVFTSGTLSGKPRLILYTRKNIESSLIAIRKLFKTEKIDQIFCYPQPTHTFGLTLGYVQAALFNIPLTFSEGAYSQAAHEKWFQSQTPGMLTLGAPVHFADLAQWLKKNNLQPKTSYSAIVGGAPITRKLWRLMVDELKISEPSVGYGATEASPGITHLSPGIEPSEDGDIGEVLDGVEILKCDEQGYYFTGPNLCAAIVDENGLQKPNPIQIKDILVKKSDGKYIFGGRADLLINRGGVKFSPEMMEAQIFSEFGFKAVCLSVYDERLGEDLRFVVQVDGADAEISKIDLRQKIKDHIKKTFRLNIADEKLVFGQIPLNGSAKYDRKEALKMILRGLNISKPINVNYLKNFLPHRSPAIWVQQILDFKHRQGVGETQLNPQSPLYSEGELRETACIELVAQTYAYSTVAYEIFVAEKSMKANKTLIAEIRNAQFYFTSENRELLRKAALEKKHLQIEAECTHDFGVIKVISGRVKLEGHLLAELGLKAFVSP